MAVAKFPRKDDEIDAVRWEAVALSLAEKAGIPVPQWRTETLAGKSILLRRFGVQRAQLARHRQF